MYHQIRKANKGEHLSGLCVSPAAFRLQMWLLKLLGYRGLSMRELAPYLAGEKQGKVVGITFDDGYQNNLEFAAPLLNRLGFSSTCYLVSGMFGQTNRWDEEQGVKQVPLMTQQEVRSWLAAGQDIGCHTRNHAKLTETEPVELDNEISRSKAELEQVFEREVADFCYPYGAYNQQLADKVEAAGFHSATTTARSRARVADNSYELPRVPIYKRTPPHLFLMKVLGSYEDKKR